MPLLAAGISVRVRGSVSVPSRLLPLLDLCASQAAVGRLTNSTLPLVDLFVPTQSGRNLVRLGGSPDQQLLFLAKSS